MFTLAQGHIAREDSETHFIASSHSVLPRSYASTWNTVELKKKKKSSQEHGFDSKSFLSIAQMKSSENRKESLSLLRKEKIPTFIDYQYFRE